MILARTIASVAMFVCIDLSAMAQDLPSSPVEKTKAELLLRIIELETEVANLRSQLLARDADKIPKVADDPKIIMQSIQGCVACDTWYLTERPKLVEAGWKVDRETVTSWPAGRMFPRWRVCFLGSCTEIENCSSAQFMVRLRSLVSRRSLLP